jgi:hypothetical protein
VALSQTIGMSFLQVSAQFESGGEFAGFRYATVSEVETLWSDAGLTGPNLGCNPASVCLNESIPTPAAEDFTALFGQTFTPIFDITGMIALTQTLYDPPWPGCVGQPYNCYVTPEIRTFTDGTSEALVIEALRDYIADPDYGSWLVEGTAIPEPKTAWFVSIAIIVLFCAYRKRCQAVMLQSGDLRRTSGPFV